MDYSRVIQRLQQPAVLQILQLSLTLQTATLAGVALCLHQWCVPMLRIGGSARSKIAQFNLIIKMGFDYLIPSSRILGATCLATIILLRSHPIPSIARQWKVYALALAIAAPVAPYEQYFIFPINDRIKAIGEELQSDGKETFDDGSPRRQELNELLNSWQKWHTWRVLAPMLAAVVTGYGLIQI